MIMGCEQQTIPNRQRVRGILRAPGRWWGPTWILLVLTLVGSPAGAQPAAEIPSSPGIELGPPVSMSRSRAAHPHARFSPASLPQGGFVVDPSSREASRLFFNTVYAASDGVDIGWTGNYATGDAGTISPGFQAAVLRRYNYFRAHAGVDAGLVLDPDYSAKAQKAALMMSVNKALTHQPPVSWTFYSADGAEAAAHGNLALGSLGPEAQLGLMRDNGANNDVLGHRRWMLFPATRKIGTGDVPGSATFPKANCTWVIDESAGFEALPTREDFVAWPPPGFTPHALVFPRWSFSHPDGTFATTTVTMERGGTNIPVRLEKYLEGYGDNTLVWVPDNLSVESFVQSGFPWPTNLIDVPLTVHLHGANIAGTPRDFTYTVIPFDAEQPGKDTVDTVLAGPAQAPRASASAYTVAGWIQADGFEVRSLSRLGAMPIEGAEKGLIGITAILSPGYEAIATDVHKGGAASFHLTTAAFEDQFLRFDRDFLVGTDAKLQFASRLGVASTNQLARVQVSADSGTSWQTLYEQKGTMTSGERTFQTRELSLAGFAGRVLRLRLAYVFTGGVAYTQTSTGVGWYVDDINLLNCESVTPASVSPVTVGTKSTWTPDAEGEFALQARPLVFGGFPASWGPAHPVTVTPPVAAPPRILGVAQSAAGVFEISLEPGGSGTLILEGAVDPAGPWTERARATSVGTGIIRIADPGTVPRSIQFYRVARR